MHPFKTSLTARIVSFAIAFALIGGGLIPTLGLRPAIALPIVLLLAVGACIVGLVVGASDHPGAVGFCAVLLPMALWAYVLVLLLVVNRFPAFAYALDAAGVAVVFSTVLASFQARDAQAREAQPRAGRTTSTEQSA
ncbi:MAG TPA: hypothetical protein VFF06_35145 [Polyangia bacterium]|nr:hypothetical protein [Polyangia bacterium]